MINYDLKDIWYIKYIWLKEINVLIQANYYILRQLSIYWILFGINILVVLVEDIGHTPLLVILLCIVYITQKHCEYIQDV